MSGAGLPDVVSVAGAAFYVDTGNIRPLRETEQEPGRFPPPHSPSARWPAASGSPPPPCGPGTAATASALPSPGGLTPPLLGGGRRPAGGDAPATPWTVSRLPRRPGSPSSPTPTPPAGPGSARHGQPAADPSPQTPPPEPDTPSVPVATGSWPPRPGSGRAPVPPATAAASWPSPREVRQPGGWPVPRWPWTTRNSPGSSGGDPRRGSGPHLGPTDSRAGVAGAPMAGHPVRTSRSNTSSLRDRLCVLRGLVPVRRTGPGTPPAPSCWAAPTANGTPCPSTPSPRVGRGTGRVRILGRGSPSAGLLGAVRRTGPVAVFLYPDSPVVETEVLSQLPRQRPAPGVLVGGRVLGSRPAASATPAGQFAARGRRPDHRPRMTPGRDGPARPRPRPAAVASAPDRPGRDGPCPAVSTGPSLPPPSRPGHAGAPPPRLPAVTRVTRPPSRPGHAGAPPAAGAEDIPDPAPRDRANRPRKLAPRPGVGDGTGPNGAKPPGPVRPAQVLPASCRHHQVADEFRVGGTQPITGGTDLERKEVHGGDELVCDDSRCPRDLPAHSRVCLGSPVFVERAPRGISGQVAGRTTVPGTDGLRIPGICGECPAEALLARHPEASSSCHCCRNAEGVARAIAAGALRLPCEGRDEEEMASTVVHALTERVCVVDSGPPRGGGGGVRGPAHLTVDADAHR
jgi:hypothetical protein